MALVLFEVTTSTCLLRGCLIKSQRNNFTCEIKSNEVGSKWGKYYFLTFIILVGADETIFTFWEVVMVYFRVPNNVWHVLTYRSHFRLFWDVDYYNCYKPVSKNFSFFCHHYDETILLILSFTYLLSSLSVKKNFRYLLCKMIWTYQKP